MNDHDDFRDRLISAQSITPEYREKYQRSLDSMFTRELTPAQRVSVALVSAGFAVFVGGAIVGLTTNKIRLVGTELSRDLAWVVIFISVAALATAVVSFWGAVTGKIDLRWQPRFGAYAMYVAVVLASVVPIAIGMVHGVTMSVVYLLGISVIFLIWSGVRLVLVHIEGSELNVREKLLEIDLKLAEMSEQMAKKQ